MSKGESLGVASALPLVDSPDLPSTSAVQEQSTVNDGVEQIAQQARLPNSAILGQTETILRFLTVDNPSQWDFASLFKLCRALPKQRIGENNVAMPNDPENALTQLFIAQKPVELPRATHLLDQMRKVLTWEALQDPDNQVAVRKVIQRLNEKMGCASQILQPKLDQAFLETNQASLELFCDLMTHQDNGLQSDTTRNRTASLLFNACPPENLEKLLVAFEQEAVKPANNEIQQSKFKHMSTCVELAIQTRNSIHEINDKKLPMENLTEVQKNNSDIVMAFIKKGEFNDFKYASDELKKNPTIALAAVQDHSGAFEDVVSTTKTKGKIAVAGVEKKGNLLQFVDPTKVKNYGEIALVAVKEDGLLIRHLASTAFKNDLTIILAALKQNKEAIKYVAPEMQRHPEVLKVL